MCIYDTHGPPRRSLERLRGKTRRATGALPFAGPPPLPPASPRWRRPLPPKVAWGNLAVNTYAVLLSRLRVLAARGWPSGRARLDASTATCGWRSRSAAGGGAAPGAAAGMVRPGPDLGPYGLGGLRRFSGVSHLPGAVWWCCHGAVRLRCGWLAVVCCRAAARGGFVAASGQRGGRGGGPNQRWLLRCDMGVAAGEVVRAAGFGSGGDGVYHG